MPTLQNVRPLKPNLGTRLTGARMAGLWLLNEGGGDARDLSGNNNHLSSTALSGYAKLGKGAVFTGSQIVRSKGANSTIPSALNISGNITISCLVNPSSFPSSGVQAALVCHGYDGTSQGFVLGFDGPSTIDFYTYNNSAGTSGVYQVAHGLTANKWYTITGTFDGSTWKVFIDGKLLSSSSSTQPPRAVNYGFSIGAAMINFENSGNGSRYFNGRIEYVGIWPRALTESEIYSLVVNPYRALGVYPTPRIHATLSSGDASPNAGAIGETASLPSAGVSASAAVTQGSMGESISALIPSVSATTVVSPAVTTVQEAIESASLTLSASVNASLLNETEVVNDPIVTTGNVTTVSVSEVQEAISAIAPALTLSATVLPNVVLSNELINSPSLSVSPSVLASLMGEDLFVLNPIVSINTGGSNLSQQDIISIADEVWARLNLGIGNCIADYVLRRMTANVESSTCGDSLNFRSLYGLIAQGVHNTTVLGNTLTVTRSDDTTVLANRDVTTDASAQPITGLDTL